MATLALAAKYSAFGAVAMGNTLGMMLANVPAVLLGNGIIQAVSLKRVRSLAAALFALLGLATLFNAGGLTGFL
ncbi:TMEM165/GDT1 family protein [Noviherbaspirillum sp. CPCC 100848]|uniref:GDT1 family protein n=1 Tax=Noviherbaspirillum album TaxID=3080276 RepID=A0ABU6J7U1_9BURK|nr:TMEM165/GDT1 family protein [Noviherbaspirillum sp. CPCC 100848]MEC4719719.1 TMEM165/GDT1 family protein [Noviherbaspirillum sp. CPCC 100848]